MPSIEFERGSSVEAALIAAFFCRSRARYDKEDYWYKYNKMKLKELVDASNGYLKRDYSAEKIGGTKDRPYKPVRRPKKRVTTKANAQVSDKETNTDIPKYEVLCNIDSSKYKAPEGSSSKVILMDERKKHIKESHPEAVNAIVKIYLVFLLIQTLCTLKMEKKTQDG